MPICPNCGSWVSEGEPTCSCGTTLSSRYEDKEQQKRVEDRIISDIKKNRLKRLRREAACLAEEGRYSEAIERYKEALDVSYSSSILTEIGDLCFDIGDYSEALFYYSSIEYNTWNKFKKRARTLYELGRFEDAVHELKEAIRYFDESSEFNVKFDRDSGNDEEYVRQYQKEFRRKKREKSEMLSVIYNELGWIYNLHGDYDKAIMSFKKGYKLDGNYAGNYNCMGIALENKGMYVEALRFYDNALKIDVDDEVILKNREGCLKKYGEDYIDGIYVVVSEYLDDALELAKSEPKPKTASALHDDGRQILAGIGRENLIVITGTSYCGNFKFDNGMKLRLVPERDNPHDDAAIAVFCDETKVGYVANSERTCCEMAQRASEFLIGEYAEAEYLMCYLGRYHIAQITGWG